MKNFLKNKNRLIISIILAFLGIGIPFAIYFISIIPQLNIAPLQYSIFLWIFAFVYLLIGFVWGDVVIARWRKVNKEWDTKLPDDVKENVWKIRLTFYLPAALVFLVAIVFDVFAMIAGFYPFM